MYRYNKTVKVWLFRDTCSFHCPLPMFVSLGCASGNKHELGALETAYITHIYTLTVYHYTSPEICLYKSNTLD